MRRLITIFSLVLLSQNLTAAIIRVDIDAQGAADGSSWTDAFTSVKEALDVAVSGDDLWIAAGTYLATDTDNPNIVYFMPCGVSLYGGFSGDETTRNQRNWHDNPTILSGEIGDTEDLTDNSNGMIYITGCADEMVISGLVMRDCYNDSFGAMVDIIDSDAVEVRQCVIEANTMPAGVSTFNSSLILKNTLLAQNELDNGVTVFGVSGEVEILNTTIADNNTSAFFSQSGTGSSLIVRNSICWNADGMTPLTSNAQEIAYCNVQGLISADISSQNISQDPQFTNAEEGDYQLLEDSPSEDAGNNSFISQGFDLAKNYRIMGDQVDMGCYEYRIPTILYVDQDATGLNLGLSWDHAFETLPAALAFAETNDELWVAEGTYTPEPGDEDGMNINKEVKIYGGFDGTENQRSQRNWVSNVTSLSGDIGVLGDDSDNTEHVLRYSLGTNFAELSVLNGFTIENGNSATEGFGSAGGGIQITGALNIIIRNCTFRNNRAIENGGAIWIGSFVEDILISQCIFESNEAVTGSAIYAFPYYDNAASRNIDLQSCLFTGNTAFNTGTLFFALGDDVSVTNSTFYGNGVSFTSEAKIIDGDAEDESWLFANNILWDNNILSDNEIIVNAGPNSEVRNSILQNPYSGNGTNVFVLDPLFTNAPGGDFSLGQNSPGINNGDDSVVDENFDVLNQPRILNGAVDLGAVETEIVVEDVIYVDVNVDANGNNDGSSWSNAFSDLGDALDVAALGEDVWIADGYYVAPGLSPAWVIPNGVSLIGGFEGIEWEIEQADPVANETIITGDTGLNNDPSDNVVSMFQMFECQTLTKISGLIFEDAFAGPNEGGPVLFLSNASSPSGSIGEILMERCILRNCNIPNDLLISVLGNAQTGNVMIFQMDNCLIHGMEDPSKIINSGTSSILRMNHCTTEYYSLDPVISIGSSSSLEINNSIFWNYAIEPMFSQTSPVEVNSSIFPFQEVDGEDNLHSLPLWVDPASGDFTLMQDSPAVDSGNNDLTNMDIDLLGNERIQNGTVDRGCYESSFLGCPADLDLDGTVGAADLLLFLSAYGNACPAGTSCPEDFDGDNLINVNDLLVFLSAYGNPC